MVILVIGLGIMGRGIAAALAVIAKRPIVIIDTSQTAVEDCLKYITKISKRNQLEPESILKTVKHYNGIKEAFEHNSIDFVIECVPESLDLKVRIYRQLNEILPENTVLATNTSSLPISKLAKAVKSPERFIGMHFFNPVSVMKGLEIIPSKSTNQDTVDRTVELGTSMGKSVSVCKKDIAGFLVNRILNSKMLEALSLLERGAGSAKDIDSIMKSAANGKMGPFELLDLVGLDTAASMSHVIYEDSGNDPRYKPSALLDRMVSEGKLGMKTGEGFYKYSSKL